MDIQGLPCFVPMCVAHFINDLVFCHFERRLPAKIAIDDIDDRIYIFLRLQLGTIRHSYAGSVQADHR